jgi:enolase
VQLVATTCSSPTWSGYPRASGWGGQLILNKVHQIGTLTETLTPSHGQPAVNAVVSHRSGETEDTTIADTPWPERRAYQTGAPAPDRVAKYNQLLRIEEELAGSAAFPGRNAFFNLK